MNVDANNRKRFDAQPIASSEWSDSDEWAETLQTYLMFPDSSQVLRIATEDNSVHRKFSLNACNVGTMRQ